MLLFRKKKQKEEPTPSLPDGFHFIKNKTLWAVSCDICGHRTTAYNDTKLQAKEEHLKRGHSDVICEWMLTGGE